MKKLLFCLALVASACGREEENIQALIKSEVAKVDDFPKKGIIFRDMLPLLKKPEIFSAVIDHWANQFKDLKIDYIAGLEARGFILGTALALKMKKPFIPVRKKGKLPNPKYSQSYFSEYSENTIKIADDVTGATILIIDDLLATGGTLEAAVLLFEKAQAKKIYSSCLIELTSLLGRNKLNNFSSIVQY